MTCDTVRPPSRVVAGNGHVLVQKDLEALLVVHVGQSVIVLEQSADRLLPVTGVSRGLVPGGLCLPAPQDLEDWSSLARRSTHLDLSAVLDLDPHLLERRDLRVPPALPLAAALDLLAAATAVPARPGIVDQPDPMDPAAQRSLASGLVASALALNRVATLRHLVDLVGAGPGSTPAGDDVIVGVVAALDACSWLSPRIGAAAEAVRRDVPALLHRTTASSRHDLRHAVAGRFSERVLAVVAALAATDEAERVLRSAGTWGATSGFDLVSGAVAAARGSLDLAPTLTTAAFTPPVITRRSA